MSRSVFKPQAHDAELAAWLASVRDDPLGYVMGAFPWGTEPLIQMVRLPPQLQEHFGVEYGPDRWAIEFLEELGRDIRERRFDGRRAVAPIMFATASGHGIGKSTDAAWLIKFVMDCYPFAKGVVTANTDQQLKTKTWAELGKWHRMSLTRDWFDYSAGRGAMTLAHRHYRETWRVDGQTCREENSEAFAGLHAANSVPFYLFDEAGGISDKIFEVREGGLTDGMPMVFDFGNPTRNSGRFYEECRGRHRHRFHVRSIDSRSVHITNKPLIEEWREAYGENSDFFKVRVRGEFPSAGGTQFIPQEVVEEAAIRPKPPPDPTQPLMIGVDVARFGDDASVIYPRLGDDARTWPARVYEGYDTVQLVHAVADCVREFSRLGLKPAAICIDGGGVGGGVVDQLRHLGYDVTEVQFGSRPGDRMTYKYRVDEIWGRMREALMNRLCIPPRTAGVHALELFEDLTQREYGTTQAGALIRLEEKTMMKKRGLRSPDIADALALTYAVEPVPAGYGVDEGAYDMSGWDYDPHEL